MNIIFLGAPGAGKGTQAEKVADAKSIPTVSTGNIIREALSNGTEMGIKAKTYIEAGNLVPDEVVIGIIQERLAEDDCKAGFILDGFPRTIPQAEALEEMGIQIDKVVDIEVPDEDIKERMSGRRVCPKCGSTYHLVTKKSKVDGICDRCGAELIQRKDDAPETVMDRLNVYHTQTEPLKDFYNKRGVLAVVDGVGSVSEIAERVTNALEE